MLQAVTDAVVARMVEHLLGAAQRQRRLGGQHACHLVHAVLRLADGPDELHRAQIGKLELKKYQ